MSDTKVWCCLSHMELRNMALMTCFRLLCNGSNRICFVLNYEAYIACHGLLLLHHIDLSFGKRGSSFSEM